jgi:hypothetical protein
LVGKLKVSAGFALYLMHEVPWHVLILLIQVYAAGIAELGFTKAWLGLSFCCPSTQFELLLMQ